MATEGKFKPQENLQFPDCGSDENSFARYKKMPQKIFNISNSSLGLFISTEINLIFCFLQKPSRSLHINITSRILSNIVKCEGLKTLYLCHLCLHAAKQTNLRFISHLLMSIHPVQ
jgi:hypothetical protein